MPAPRWPLLADEPEYDISPIQHGGVEDDGGICGRCPRLEECQERVAIGKWVACEIPDS